MPSPARRPARASGHRLDAGCQPALLAGGGVLVNDVLVGDRVDQAEGTLVDGARGLLVARGDRLPDVPDRASQLRAQGGVVQAALFGLPRALARRCDVGHCYKLRVLIRKPSRKKGAILLMLGVFCNEVRGAG